MDHRAVLHRHARPEHDIRLHRHVPAQHGIMREEHRFRRDQRGTIGHRLGAAQLLPVRLHPRQFRTAVDARHFARAGLDHGAFLPRQHHDIGQIIFPRRIIVADLVEQHEQVRRARRHQAAIAQGDSALGLARVLIFHHLLDRAGAVRHDPPIGRRIIGPETQHHAARIVPETQTVDHRLHGLGAHQRHIAVEDQHIAGKALERVMRLAHGMAGAQLLGLLGNDDVAVRQAGGNLLLARADHHDGALHTKRAQRVGQMMQHRLARNGVQNLVQIGLHARAGPGGKHDGGERTIGVQWLSPCGSAVAWHTCIIQWLAAMSAHDRFSLRHHGF